MSRGGRSNLWGNQQTGGGVDPFGFDIPGGSFTFDDFHRVFDSNDVHTYINDVSNIEISGSHGFGQADQYTGMSMEQLESQTGQQESQTGTQTGYTYINDDSSNFEISGSHGFGQAVPYTGMSMEQQESQTGTPHIPVQQFSETQSELPVSGSQHVGHDNTHMTLNQFPRNLSSSGSGQQLSRFGQTSNEMSVVQHSGKQLSDYGEQPLHFDQHVSKSMVLYYGNAGSGQPSSGSGNAGSGQQSDSEFDSDLDRDSEPGSRWSDLENLSVVYGCYHINETAACIIEHELVGHYLRNRKVTSIEKKISKLKKKAKKGITEWDRIKSNNEPPPTLPPPRSGIIIRHPDARGKNPGAHRNKKQKRGQPEDPQAQHAQPPPLDIQDVLRIGLNGLEARLTDTVKAMGNQVGSEVGEVQRMVVKVVIPKLDTLVEDVKIVKGHLKL